MADFYLKRHDRLPVLLVVLKDSAGQAVDLSLASGVVFTMTLVGAGSPKVNRQVATIVDAPNGTVSFDWGAADTDTIGEYQGEFEVTFPTAKPETFPNTSYITISIVADLA